MFSVSRVKKLISYSFVRELPVHLKADSVRREQKEHYPLNQKLIHLRVL